MTWTKTAWFLRGFCVVSTSLWYKNRPQFVTRRFAVRDILLTLQISLVILIPNTARKVGLSTLASFGKILQNQQLLRLIVWLHQSIVEMFSFRRNLAITSVLMRFCVYSWASDWTITSSVFPNRMIFSELKRESSSIYMGWIISSFLLDTNNSWCMLYLFVEYKQNCWNGICYSVNFWKMKPEFNCLRKVKETR